MNILLYKDGRLLIDEGNPMEGVSLDGLAVCITDPTDGQVLTYDGTKWTNANLPTPESEPAAGGEG